LKKFERLLNHIPSTLKTICFSYCFAKNDPKHVFRRSRGWVNSYNENDLAEMLRAIGFGIESSIVIEDFEMFTQRIYKVTRI
jgi:hypothetical protein